MCRPRVAAKKIVHHRKLRAKTADDRYLLRLEGAQDVAESFTLATIPTLVLVVNEASHRSPFHHLRHRRWCRVVRVARVYVDCIVANQHARTVRVRCINEIVLSAFQLFDWELAEAEEVVCRGRRERERARERGRGS